MTFLGQPFALSFPWASQYLRDVSIQNQAKGQVDMIAIINFQIMQAFLFSPTIYKHFTPYTVGLGIWKRKLLHPEPSSSYHIMTIYSSIGHKIEPWICSKGLKVIL